MSRIPVLAAAALFVGAATPATAQQKHDAFPPGDNDAVSAMCRSAATDQSCVLADKVLSYWFSFDTVVDGRKWYTAIGIGRPRDGSHLLGPDAKMPISQVTYELKNGAWTLIARQIALGEVYVNNSGNPAMSDDDGDAVQFNQKLPDGVLIGYPTVTMAGGGVNLHGHAMFLSTPDKSGNWHFGGEIIDASDNWADCDREMAPQTCYRSYGKLSLTGRTVAGWPEIQASQTGTLPGPDGKARRARPTDESIWRFPPAEHAYTADSPR